MPFEAGAAMLGRGTLSGGSRHLEQGNPGGGGRRHLEEVSRGVRAEAGLPPPSLPAERGPFRPSRAATSFPAAAAGADGRVSAGRLPPSDNIR